jgi:hypothetical protein
MVDLECQFNIVAQLYDKNMRITYIGTLYKLSSLFPPMSE